MSGQNPPPPWEGQQPAGSQAANAGQVPVGPGQQGFPQYPSGGAAPPTSAKGFFGALFDFSFEHFITPIIVKVVYVVATVVLALVWLILTVSTLAESPGRGVLVLILGAVIAILYLAFIRMTLEFYLAVVRMSQDIHHRPLG